MLEEEEEELQKQESLHNLTSHGRFLETPTPLINKSYGLRCFVTLSTKKLQINP